MIPIILNRAIKGRDIVETLAKAAEGQGWQVKRFSDTALSPGSVKKIEINRGLRMKIPLGERQTRFSRVNEDLVVRVGDLGENDIRTANLLVSIEGTSISRLAPRGETKRGEMVSLFFMAAVASIIVPSINRGPLWTFILGAALMIIFLIPGILFISGYGSREVCLNSSGYEQIEPKINVLLLDTFNNLGKN